MSDVPADSLPNPAPTHSRGRRVLKWVLITLVSLVALVALLLGSFTLIMSRVPGSRAQLQAWISAQAKLPVTFSEVSAGWRRYGPELRFNDAVVRSADGQRVLIAARQGGIGFDLWTALRTGRLAAGRFSLSGTELQAIRREDGSLELVGQADLPEYERRGPLNLDALPVGQVDVEDVRFSFRDLKTGREPWVVNNVAFTIHRDRRMVTLNGHATLPRNLGQTLEFNARANGSLAEVDSLRWHAQVKGIQLDLAGWAQVMRNDSIAPRAGNGSFELAADFIGAEPMAVNGQLSFTDVALMPPAWSTPLPQADPLEVRDSEGKPVPRVETTAELSAPAAADTVAAPAMPALTASAAETVKYARIAMNVSATHTAHRWQLKLSQLQLSREGMEWQPGTVRLDIERDNGRSRVLASADLLILDNLWPLLAWLPESDANATVRALNATGQLRNIALRLERDDSSAPLRYGVRADLSRLGVSPVKRNPGINGLSGVLTASGARGEFQLDSTDFAVNIPWLFRTPLPADEVRGTFNWTRDAAGTHVQSPELAIRSPDGRAEFKLALELPTQGEPLLDLSGELHDLDAAATPRYIPAGVTPPMTLRWLDGAFLQGRVTQAHAEIKGPIRHFPFRDKSGLFLARAEIEGMTLNYQPGWVPATNLKLQAEFRNIGVSARILSGEVNGLRLLGGSGGIKDFRAAELRVDARGAGELTKGLEYVQQSPVGPAIGELFQSLRGSGELAATGSMFFPLKDPTKHQLRFDVELKNGTLGLKDVAQQATQVNGQLQISNDAVTAAALSGTFLQGPIVASTVPASRRGRFNLQVDGHAQAVPLMQFLKLPGFVKLDGETDYRFVTPAYPQKNDDGGRQLFTVDSALDGLALQLPAPLGKPSKSRRALHVETQLRGKDVMEVRASLDALRALLRLKQDSKGWRFDRGTVRADAIAAALPTHAGLRIEGAIDSFTLDDWLHLGEGSTTTAGSSASTVRVQDILRTANVNIGRFRLYGFEWLNARGILQAADNGWRIDVSGPQATGQINVPYNFASNRPLTLEMERFVLTPQKNAGKDTATPSTASTQRKDLDPRELPAISARVKSFEFDDHDFGELVVAASRVPQGLKLDSAQITGPSFNGMASGSWLQASDGVRTQFDVTLDSSDVRATLQQLNYGDFVAAKRGALRARLTWPGGLDADMLGRASGTLNMNLSDGQLLSVQPGAGRVLGLLSVAALPRRLRLDFRDVTDKGLSFDAVSGDFTVTNGDAHTENLVLRGPSAEIGMVGRIGLGKRDYDQTAVVTGEVGSALPLAGAAIAANPVVGAALLLFSQVFKEPLKGVTRAYYHIGGSWDEPLVERIDSDAARAAQNEPAVP